MGEWRVVRRSDGGTATHYMMSLHLVSIQHLKKENYKIYYISEKVTMHERSIKPEKYTKQTVKSVAETSKETPLSLQTEPYVNEEEVKETSNRCR
ncbi:hypothetical protein J6590_093769 [Homalodisca vitripennis]|nr:hypothetical protein J6590_093769 [Homalodisca vitripennis]